MAMCPSRRSPSTRRLASAPSFVLLALALAGAGLPAAAQEPSAAEDLPPYLADRGRGIAVSMFGTFVEPGEWLVYPFYEYTRTPNFEYHPSELGAVGGTDFMGKLFEREALLFLAYGISDRVAVELEGALYAKTTFEKAPDDPSDLPSRFSESGLGDVEGQLRWRWREETATAPELYSFFEVVLPLQKDKVLIGTQDWEGAVGLGFLRGHSWGTIGGRLAVAWDGEDGRAELGEYAVEYVKQASPGWRLYLGLEGESVEVSLVTEAQWRFHRHALLKLNCGFGLAEQSPDVAPEVGVLFRF
jgi:hypothetical protein